MPTVKREAVIEVSTNKSVDARRSSTVTVRFEDNETGHNIVSVEMSGEQWWDVVTGRTAVMDVDVFVPTPQDPERCEHVGVADVGQDHPEIIENRCEYPKGHGPVEHGGFTHAHGAPSKGTYWAEGMCVCPPEDEPVVTSPRNGDRTFFYANGEVGEGFIEHVNIDGSMRVVNSLGRVTIQPGQRLISASTQTSQTKES